MQPYKATEATNDVTEFFIKALYYHYTDWPLLAEMNLDLAIITADINGIYKILQRDVN